MMFSYESAVREAKREIEAGNLSVTIRKRWYGWIVVHLVLLLCCSASFGQLVMGPSTSVYSVVAQPATMMTWLNTSGTWKHYATNSTGSYVDGVSASFGSVVPWTLGATTQRVGNVAGTWDDPRGYLQDYNTNGLVSYWSMRTSGTTVYDEFGGNHGAATNGITFGAEYGKNDVGALTQYASPPQHVRIPVADSLRITSAMTISAWTYRTNTTASYAHIVDKNNGYAISIVSGVFQASYGRAWRNSGVSIPLNEWVHLVAAYDGTATTFYTNGTLAATVTHTGTGQNNEDPITIGSGVNLYRFIGKLDEVSVWNRALSSNEVSTIYNSGAGKFYPNNVTSNQLAYYVLNTANRYGRWDLASSSNLLAIAQHWDYSGGNTNTVLALDFENTGVPDGVAVTNQLRDRSTYGNHGTAVGSPIHTNTKGN